MEKNTIRTSGKGETRFRIFSLLPRSKALHLVQAIILLLMKEFPNIISVVKQRLLIILIQLNIHLKINTLI